MQNSRQNPKRLMLLDMILALAAGSALEVVYCKKRRQSQLRRLVHGLAWLPQSGYSGRLQIFAFLPEKSE